MIIERECREQREQPNHFNRDECSQDPIHTGNNENNLAPVMVPPLRFHKPKIERNGYLSHEDWFELNGKKMKPGVYWHGKKQQDGESIEVDDWICSPLTIEGISSSPTHDNFGRLLKFQDTNGQWHEWAMPMFLLKGNGDELRGELLNQGVIFNPKRRSDIVNYIMTQQTSKQITAVDRVGWHDKAFVLPNMVIGDANVIFQSETVAESEFQSKGSLNEWQEQIGKLCVDNIPLMVSVCMALAGPLLKFVDRQQGGGIHWIGDSSSGKSTAVEVAASVWGSPEFIRSWSATANGLEGVAATRNETCLILDEIDEAAPLEIGKIAYMLGNGQGKQRAGRVGLARKIQRWRIMTLSTGERTLTSIMNEIGKRPNAGQLVRLLSIPVTFEHGAFSNLHGFESGRALADHLKAARLKHYGHLGPAFIEKLIEDKRDFTNLLDLVMQKFSSATTTNVEKRASSIFAIIGLTGELGIEYGLLPWEQGSAFKASHSAFQRWQAFIGPGQTEDRQILEAISNFIAKHGDSRFSPQYSDISLSNDKTIQNRAGWYKVVNEERVYMFHPVALLEAGAGFERSRIVEALKRAKWLVDSDPGRMTKKTRTSAGVKNLYHMIEQVEL